MSYRPVSLRMIRAATFVLFLGLLAAAALPARASVTLTTFEATPQGETTIRVRWAAATELEIASYNLYRAETNAPADWGAPIYQVAAGGSVAPKEYEYPDSAVTPGVTYYYKLEDISTSGQRGSNGPVSARILLAGETPTNTPTATQTWTSVPTATTGAGVGGPTATLTPPPPTATRAYTNTPVVSPAGTPVVSAPTAPVVGGRVTPTLVSGASVATPTGQARLQPTAPIVAQQPTVAPVALPPTASPTAALIAQAPGAGLETATPVPTKAVTPIIFAASETQEAGATPESEQAVAAQGSRNMSGVLTVGGAALGLAGLLAALYLFMRSRKG